MTNAEIVFNELERQGLHSATLSMIGDKLYIEGLAEIDCDALASAIKKARFVLPCPPDRSLGGPGLPESLSVLPNIPWSMLTIDQLEEERAYWDAVVASNHGPASVASAIQFAGSCSKWIEKRRTELAYRQPIGRTPLAAH
jgi:hypothetical protein